MISRLLSTKWMLTLAVLSSLCCQQKLFAQKIIPSPEADAAFSNGIYNLFVITSGFGIGTFTIGTGPSHPVTIATGSSQNVIYGGSSGSPATSFNSIRSFTSGTTYTFGGRGGGVNLDGCSPTAASTGSGFTVTYNLTTCGPRTDTLSIQSTVQLHGTTASNTTVEITTTLRNTGLSPISLGIRYLLDWQIGRDDGPTFQALNPGGTALVTEAAFAPSAFESYRIQDNDANAPSPLFNVLGTAGGPSSVVPIPTPPTELDFVSWPNSFGTSFDYTVNGSLSIATGNGLSPTDDSATLYYWGRNSGNALVVPAGGVVTVSASILATQPGGSVGSNPGSPVFFGSTGTSTNPTANFTEPVNTATGNYYASRTDFQIPGRGLSLIFTRYYNSLDTYSGPLGAGWTHSFNILLIEATGTGMVTIKQGDGAIVAFVPSGGGSYVPQTAGVFSTLVKNADNTFSLTQKNQTRFAFSSAGKLTNIQDKNGNTITLTYDGSGNLSLVTDTVGRNLTFSYDGSNRISQITDLIGRTVTFTYNGTNDLVRAVDPAGGVTQFAYNADHRVTSITQPNGQLLLTNTYDTSGRVATQTNGRGFTTTFSFGTPNPGDTTVTDARGNKTIHTYDNSLRIVKVTDTGGWLTQFAYDANNDRTGVTNQNGKTTTFAYDAQGNITTITDPLSNLIAFTYDAKNNLLGATNAKGKTTTFLYNASSNLTKITDAAGNQTQFGYDGFGQLTSRTDARGNTTTYAYGASGSLTRITDALGNATVLSYDAIGRLGSITDANGHSATATYDALSRLTKITDPLANQTQFAYDLIGNLLKITDANLHATAYAYDAANNLTMVTDALAHVTAYAYDPNNNRVSFTNAKNNVTAYAYDALNRLVRITDPLSFATVYGYDPVGNVLTITDAKAQTNQFTYDALNRLTSIAYADGKAVAYAYDGNGNRSSMVDSHGTTAYSYDVLDRLASVNQPGGKVVTYGYDAVGSRKSVTYPDNKTVNYTYDLINRLSHASDWLGRATTYTYDPASNLTKTLYPTGASVGFSYDAANRLLQVANAYQGSMGNPIASFRYLLDPVGNRLQVTDGSGVVTAYTYDALNQLTSVAVEDKVTRFTYDAAGNRLTLAAPGTSINYSYDAADRLLAAIGRQSKDSATFTYDANGNQITKTASGTTLTYAYDAANRLVSVGGGEVNSAFSYDGDGNRVTQTVGAGTYTYLNDVATALPVVLQEAGPDGGISYAYGLGLISESGPGFDFFYHYDGLGSVVGLTEPSGKLAGRYLYDAWGQLVQAIPAPQLGTKNKFQFTGEALDPGTGLCYLRARYYDPSVGRFISKDPSLGFMSVPRSLNRYVYAMNVPTFVIDPTGLTGTVDIPAQRSDPPFSASISTTGLFSRLATKVGILTFETWERTQRASNTISSGIKIFSKALGGVRFFEKGGEVANPTDQEILAWIQTKENTEQGRTVISDRILATAPTEITLQQWDTFTPQQKIQIVKSSEYYNTRPRFFKGAADLLWEGFGIVY